MTIPSRTHTARIAFAAALLGATLGCASHGAKTGTTPAAAPDSGSATAPAAKAAAPRGGREAQSIEEMLAGKFPGVTVDQASNGGLRIRIRGGNTSFYNGEEPLFIVDEVPLPQGSNGILFLNPYDITKIQVLKNPADVAIYGIRGANGVIKITTKPGAGRP
jgi:TonB-dependent SusC/RagA subfamily outer membrane receptor